jgi:hypothetical protein
MKHKLSPDSYGTLAALHHKRRLKFFSPECAEELISAGFAYKEDENLAITDVGVQAGKMVYLKGEKTKN